MKTPREILLARHHAVDSKLDEVRRGVIARQSASSIPEPEMAFVLQLWRELILPCRRLWTGMAAIWVGIFVVNISMRDNSPAVAMKFSPTPEMIMAFQQQERLLAELMGPPVTLVAEPPKKSTPQPRSETRGKIATA